MTFVTASLAVAGVVSVAVPILIFLLWRQRRSPIEWAAMRFLLEAYRKHRRRLQVEQILLLLIRCLVLALLGFALARPLLEGTSLMSAGGSRLVYVILDNGLAAGLEEDGAGPDATAFVRSVEQARTIVDGLDPGDRVGVITTARPAADLLAPASSDLAAVKDLLASLEPSVAPTDVSGALTRLADALDGLEDDQEQAFVYLISDFRAGSVALEQGLPDRLETLSERVVFLASPPATESADNVQVTAVQPSRSVILPGATDGSEQVTVRLARHGGELDRAVSSVRLTGRGISRTDTRSVNWEPGQTEASVDFLLDIAAGGEQQLGITAVIDGDRLAADNERHAVLSLRQQIRVLLISRRTFGFEPGLDRLTAAQWIRRALEPTDASPLEIVEVEPAALDTADLRVADAAVLPRPDLVSDHGWTLLRRFVDRGGLLLLSPPAEVNVHRWIEHVPADLGLPWSLRREVSEHPEGLGLAPTQPSTGLLRMILGDLSELVRPVVVTKMLGVDAAGTQGGGAETVLALADGTPLLLAGSPVGAEGADADLQSRGLVTYLAVAPELDWTNLPGRPLMVPLYQELVRQGLSLIRGARPVDVGTRPALPVGPAATVLQSPAGRRTHLDESKRPRAVLVDAGLHEVLDAADQPVGMLAINIDPAAGRTEVQPEAAVLSWLRRSAPWRWYDPADVAAELRRAESGSPLAGALLLAVVVLLLVETLLAKLFSHAGHGESTRGAAGLQPSMIRSAGFGAGGAS